MNMICFIKIKQKIIKSFLLYLNSLKILINLMFLSYYTTINKSRTSSLNRSKIFFQPNNSQKYTIIYVGNGWEYMIVLKLIPSLIIVRLDELNVVSIIKLSIWVRNIIPSLTGLKQDYLQFKIFKSFYSEMDRFWIG